MKNLINKNNSFSKFVKKAANFGSVFCVAMLSFTPVWADDTEIFFGDLTGGGAAPNVLFILDTSGSMSNQDGTGRSRIDRVKDALKDLLTGLNNVNVGLMRFSNPGGPILYPVSYIDDATGHSPGEASVTSTVSASSDDATENLTDTTVNIDSVNLKMGTVAVGAVTSGDTIIYPRVDEPNEDAIEEHADKGSSVFLSRVKNNGNPHPLYVNHDRWGYFGVRFSGLEIPPGSIILSSSLELTTHRANKRVRARIYGDIPPASNMIEQNNNISDRRTSTESVFWNMTDAQGNVPDNGEKIYSPDLTDLIQELVSSPSWEGDTGTVDDILLVLESEESNTNNRYREFKTVEMNDTKSAQLTIRYSDEPVVKEPHTAGIRFNEVNLPQNVTVTSAYLELTPSVADSEAASLTVAIENGDAPVAYTDSNGNVSGRGAGGSVTWNSAAGNWENDRPEQIDVTSLVNARASEGNWCGGEPMNFIISGDVGSRIAHSFDSSSSKAPKLHITYDQSSLVPGSSCRAMRLMKRITHDGDDGTSTGTGVAVASAGDTINVSGDSFGLFRFADLDIPSNATVQSAYLRLYAGADLSGSTTLSLAIENAGDAAAIGGEFGVSTRAFTGAVGWSIDSDWEQGTSYQSPNINGLINSALTSGWNEGNNMLLRVKASSGSGRTIYAHDFSTQTKAAQLIINYIDDGTQGANTVRDEMVTVVDSLNDNGYTPVQDTFYEAYQYYTGGDVVWGKYRGGLDEDGNEVTFGAAEDGPFSYTRVSAKASIKPATWSGRVLPPGCPNTNSSDSDCNDSNGPGEPKGEYLKGSPEYESPINNYCQAESHIILLTDGIANEPHSETLIKDIDGISACQDTSADGRTNMAQKCVLELAYLMQNTDVSDLDEAQRITTHTIGFEFSSDWLREVANQGGGLYKEAGDGASLVGEIEAILADVLKTNTSFVAPVAAINQFNRLTNLNDVYFAVFRPDDVPRWPGNLKRYELKKIGSESNVLVDAEKLPAVSPTTGFFKPDSRSVWSAEEDGAKVDSGGAASKFPAYDDRKVYTWLGLSDTLTDSSNLVTTSNSDLTASILSVPDDIRTSQIQWIRGQDVDNEDGDSTTDENRYIMGDPLHSKPVAITYGAPDPNDPGKDTTIFMGTNGGSLHAIDADDGVELFSFMPKEMFQNQVILRKNNTVQKHVYGIDGSITAWTKDHLNDGITPGGLDFVRLYAGQRRGGRNYYALDVTNRVNPKILWQIEGGVTSGFNDLGQTWSRPILGRVDLKDESPRDVLFFAGGYDAAKDSYSVKAEDSVGRALYVVDALTGELIWSGGHAGGTFDKNFADMKYSIPSGLTVADTDSDGLDDVIFVGDTGGQLWRFDIAKDAEAADLVDGGVIGDFAVGGDLDKAKNRMFYHSPDVALIELDGTRQLALTIGSGKRPNPLGQGYGDQFFMIRQGAVYGPPASYVKNTHDDLYDVTLNLIQQGTDEEKAAAKAGLASKVGWYFDLPFGAEKVLSTPLTFRNTVTFATYSPNNQSDSCVAKAGTSRTYQVELEDGSAVNNWDDLDGLTGDDRYFELDTPSIIDEPVIICTGDGCDLFTGAEKPPIDTLSNGSIIKTFWRQDQ